MQRVTIEFDSDKKAADFIQSVRNGDQIAWGNDFQFPDWHPTGEQQQSTWVDIVKVGDE
jgi:hypothetical protein